MALFQGWRVWHRRRHPSPACSAERRPDSVAVVFGAEQVSDGELNRPVNRLAHYLRKRGVNPATPVGLRLKR